MTVPNPIPPHIPLTIEKQVPNGLNKDGFLKTDSQLHSDLPRNTTVQQDLIRILQAITPSAQPDAFEDNDSVGGAVTLGSLPEVTLRDLTIHDPADVDVFNVTAHETGTLIVSVIGGPVATDLRLQVLDAAGAVVATSSNSQIVIPVVGQQHYFVEISSATGSSFCYDLEIENFETVIPTRIDLDSFSDSGRFNNDDLTNNTSPSFRVFADLSTFAQRGINVLNSTDYMPASLNQSGRDGAAVFVRVLSLIHI